MEQLAKRIRATRLIGALDYEQILFILNNAKTITADEGDIILSEEDENNCHMLVTRGEVEVQRVWKTREGKAKSYTRNLKPKDVSGGFAYVSAAADKMRVRALTDVECVLIDADLNDYVLEICAQLSDEEGTLKDKDHLLNLFKQISVMHQLPVENLKEAIYRLQPVEVEAGDDIITQGEAGDKYYLIETGEAQVWKTDPFTDELEMVAKLTPGDAFGEEALIQDGMRNAGVKMVTPGKLWSLQKSDFDELVKPNLVDEIDAEQAQKMLSEGVSKLIDCRYDMEFEDSRLIDAKHFALDRLRWDIHNLNPDDEYIVYCRSGRRSRAAVFLMKERKFKAVSLQGGIKEWPYELDAEPMY